MWLSALLTVASVGCGDDAAGDSDASESTETAGETGGAAPELAADPELVFHPHQPMIVDVIVTLDRPGTVALVHDSDAGVRPATLDVSDDGTVHRLRVRGLLPAAEHAVTLTLADLDDPSASAEVPLSFATQTQLPGFRPSFEVELSDAAALDPAYRLFDYANTPLWDPAGLFVIDPQGVTRWYYEGGLPGLLGPTAIWAGVELLDDGSLLAVRDGAVQIIDELGEQRLYILGIDLGLPAFHHDVILLANGNFLALTNSFQDVDYSSLNLGLGITHVAGDLLVELDPAGDIVWEWDSFDHLDPLRVRSLPGDGLEYYDPETDEYGFDWTHGNGMVHSADDDVILLSMRHQDWIIAIDHQSGEVLWRLGTEGDFELQQGTWFLHQHSPQWQSDGTLLLYDNGLDFTAEPGTLRSRAVRYQLDQNAMTATQVWDSATGAPYLSPVAGDADVTPSGNTLVLDSTLQPDPAVFDIGQNYSRITEVGEAGDASPVWSLTTKLGSFVYRATAIDSLPGELD